MMRILASLPRHVLISVAAMAGALIVFAIAFPLLGGARDDAFADNDRLKKDIEGTTKSISQVKEDTAFVIANQAKYEALLQGDRLIPHTRRAATQALESVARANGVTGLNYSIAAAAAATSLQSAQSQPVTGGYRVSVENITIKIGAPLDGVIYKFMADITDSFPGAAVIQTVTLERADKGRSMGNGLASGELVTGEILMSWRTAQAEESKDGEAKKK